VTVISVKSAEPFASEPLEKAARPAGCADASSGAVLFVPPARRPWAQSSGQTDSEAAKKRGCRGTTRGTTFAVSGCLGAPPDDCIRHLHRPASGL